MTCLCVLPGICWGRIAYPISFPILGGYLGRPVIARSQLFGYGEVGCRIISKKSYLRFNLVRKVIYVDQEEDWPKDRSLWDPRCYWYFF